MSDLVLDRSQSSRSRSSFVLDRNALEQAVSSAATSETHEISSSDPPPVPQTWITPGQIRTQIDDHIRDQMSRWMSDLPIETARSIPSLTERLQKSFNPTSTSPIAPSLLVLAQQIIHDMSQNLQVLLTLNRGRRNLLVKHLNEIAGISKPGQAAQADSLPELKRWIEGPRTPQQDHALSCFLEEVAYFCLGQILVLKSWSDRGIRTWSKKDLDDLNWTFINALRPCIPPSRDRRQAAWQLTRPNLYSWYKLKPTLKEEIWKTLEGCSLQDRTPALLLNLAKNGRKSEPDWPELKGYDTRFYTSLWEKMPHFGFDPTTPAPGVIPRKNVIFSPTLRDGALLRAMPQRNGNTHSIWIGLESHPFQLMLAELSQLWAGPSAPPTWAQGNGLEVHTREQLSIQWENTETSEYSKITEMEACDLAFVIEERCIRSQGRAVESTRFRQQLDSLSYFKHIKDHSTTLGDLQACVALSKIRPGGLLWWTREEPLSSLDGERTLHFLLDRGKLLCEWDFSGVKSQLPGPLPLFPKHLYLFLREPNVESRHQHRPKTIKVKGTLRSHTDVPKLIEDAIMAFHDSTPSRGAWKTQVIQSPSPQQEWAEKWPDPTNEEVLVELDRLRENTTPLGQIGMVRGTEVNPQTLSKNSSMGHGIWLSQDLSPKGHGLQVSPLNRVSEAQSGFAIFLPDERWVAPLSAWIQSDRIRNWLDHHAERKKGRWVLDEQTLKFIPIPNTLIQAVRDEGYIADPRWEQLATEILNRPRVIREALGGIQDPVQGSTLRTSLFVRVAKAIRYIEDSQKRLFTLVKSDGSLCWKEFLKVLPPTELLPVVCHPGVRWTGTLPPHLPIARIEKVTVPMPGILLSSETGFHLHAAPENSTLMEILMDQLQGVAHPTWTELSQYLVLPRNLELARGTAADILRSYTEQTQRKQELHQLLNECQNF